MLSKELLNIICCPMDKADLVYSKAKQTLTCKKCKFVYPIKEDIPVLLPPEMQDEAAKKTSKKNGWKNAA
tara:strand:+ start:3038 stop:3247 length:210 start_codon:yes stop_codon:yes gene_type:complete